MLKNTSTIICKKNREKPSLKYRIMKFSRILPDLDTEERLDAEMQEEIDTQIHNLDRIFENIESLIGLSRSKEVRKAMINHLVEKL